MTYFPRFTQPYQRRLSERDWEHRGPAAFRRIAFSSVEMALITGVFLRFGRAALLANAGATSGAVFVAGFILGALVLFTMATLHLGNFPLRHWTWRAPVFALLEAAVESLASLLLIAVGREPYGSDRADLADWPALVSGILTWRLVTIVVFALALAAVVQWVRLAALRREQRL